ncbi:hypothetical protein LTR95_003558, partial [Oleoguttula sp. CCFEE 5521]
MNKLKSMLGKGHEEENTTTGSTGSSSAAAPTTQSRPAGSASGVNPDNAEGVVLHTTLGDITIALFKDQTPR